MKQIKETVHDDLLNRIIYGQVPPDEILKENTLITHYNVSRAPVREALLMLCTEGVLRAIPRVGYLILPVNDKMVSDLIQFRVILECGSLQHSFGNVTPEFIERLRVADKNQHTLSMQPFQPFWEANIAFHSLLLSLSDNAYMIQQLEEAMRTQYRAFVQYVVSNELEGKLNNKRFGHVALINAIENADSEKAASILREDIEDFRFYHRLLR